MSEPTTQVSTAVATEAAKQPPLKPLSPVVWWLRECIAMLVWAFIGIKLFVFDLDRAILNYAAPSLLPALDFRLFILLGSLAFLWLFLANERFFRFVGYIIGYPLVVLFWTIPKLLVRNWAVLLAFAPALHAFFSTFRWNFIAFTAAVISGLVLQLDAPFWANIAAIACLSAYLVLHYVRRLRLAFTTRSVFSEMVTWIRAMSAQMVSQTQAAATQSAEPLDPESEQYKQKRNAELLGLYAVLSVLSFTASRLRDVIRSRLDFYFVGSLAYTFLVTVVVFAFVYQGIERVLPGSFQAPSHGPGFWTFLGFSFSTVMTAETWGVSPSGSTALVLSYCELFGSLVLIVLLAFVILTSIRERYRDDAGRLADELRSMARRIAGTLENQYGLTIVATKGILIAANPDFVRMLVRLYDPEDVQTIGDDSILG